MDSQVLIVIFDTAAALWVLLFLVQVVDVVTGRKLRRAGRATGTRDRDRLLTWTIIVCSIVLVLVVFGVVLAARIILDAGQVFAGAFVMIMLIAVTASSAVIAARVLGRPASGYPVLLDELRGAKGTRVAKGRVGDYRRWLDTIDSRSGDVRRRVLAGRWLRVIPPAVGLIGLITAIMLVVGGVLPLWVAVAFLIAVIASAALSVAGARRSLARNLAVNAVHQKQRTEILTLLDELDRRAPKRSAGLTDRVSRALAILREQQGQEHRR